MSARYNVFVVLGAVMVVLGLFMIPYTFVVSSLTTGVVAIDTLVLGGVVFAIGWNE